MLWIHMWIQCYEECCEIRAEFLEMNSHMKSWSNSLFLKYSWFSFKFVSVRGYVLLIQSNHHLFFAVSSLHALRLLCGCCLVATRRCCCDCRRRVLRTAEQRGRGRRCKHMMDVTGVEISWAFLSARKETLETFKLRDYQTDQPQGHNPDGAIRSSEAFQQMIVIPCITANIAQTMTWRFTGEDLAEECFQPSCRLQHWHYANTDTNKMQVTSEEAKEAQSWEKSPIERNIVRWNGSGSSSHLNLKIHDNSEFEIQCLTSTEDLIELHDCHRQTWVQQFWIQNLKMPIFFCLSMLEIYKQSLKPNDLKGIQLYSSHSVACRCIWRKGKHSGHCDWTLSNIFFFWLRPSLGWYCQGLPVIILPSLGWYCQGVIRYRIACQA